MDRVNNGLRMGIILKEDIKKVWLKMGNIYGVEVNNILKVIFDKIKEMDQIVIIRVI